jgi:hypothetical protein
MRSTVLTEVQERKVLNVFFSIDSVVYRTDNWENSVDSEGLGSVSRADEQTQCIAYLRHTLKHTLHLYTDVIQDTHKL